MRIAGIAADPVTSSLLCYYFITCANINVIYIYLRLLRCFLS